MLRKFAVGLRVIFLISFFAFLILMDRPCHADNWMDVCRRRIALTIGGPAHPAKVSASKHPFGYAFARLLNDPYDSFEASKTRQQLADLIKIGNAAAVNRALVAMGSDRVKNFFFWFPSSAALIVLAPIFGSAFVEDAIANNQPEILHVLLKHGFRLNSSYSEHPMRADAQKNLDLPEIKSVFERHSLR